MKYDRQSHHDHTGNKPEKERNMENSVACIAHDRKQADRIVDRLKEANLPGSSISVVFADRRESRNFAIDKDTKAPEGAIAGVGTGGVIGGAVGLLAGIGAITIPGIGPLIAVGPLMSALSGAAVGAGIGGIAGALIGLGYPEYVAKNYEARVKGGDILITFRSSSEDEIERARDIFVSEGATDISALREPERETVGPRQ
jgi:outer membrane lipoprotein SlyB